MNKILSIKLLPLLFLLLAVLSTACSGPKATVRRGKKELDSRFARSAAFSQAFTGFALYDPEKGEWLYQKNSDKYFTPASNVKILTLFAALKILGDSIPALSYIERGDSLIFQGTASPVLAHPYLPADSTVFRFLKSQHKKLFFSGANFTDQVYGPAWGWDDFSYEFQCQRSALPFHGNRVQIDWERNAPSPVLHPAWFEKYLLPAVQEQQQAVVSRPFQNQLTYSRIPPHKDYQRMIPVAVSDSLTVRLLADYLQQAVHLWPHPFDSLEAPGTLSSLSVDTLYRKMMQQSDNFIAEQLLLACSQKIFGEMNSGKIIHYLKRQYFEQLPDTLLWFDGSGLSRYNLMTPRSIVKVLEQLRRAYGDGYLQGIFAAGGRTGTISEHYAGKEEPFIYAKTGTMRNRHCLSGYLIAQSGKLLIFSFMHNNYPGNSRQYKLEMAFFLNFIHEQF